MLTVRQLYEAFDAYNRSQRAARTAEFYRDRLKPLVAALGELPAAELRPHQLYSLGSSWHFFLACQRLYGWAAKEAGLLEVNPLATLKRPRLKRRRRVLDRKTSLTLLRGAAADFREFLVCLRESAARPQEGRVLSWEHLHWPGGLSLPREALRAGQAFFVLDEFKGRDRRADDSGCRIIPISPRLGRLLWRIFQRRPAEGIIFRTRTGQAWNRNSLGLRLRRLLKRTGLTVPKGKESVCCYHFRHTAATNFAANGMNGPVLKELLGQSDLKTTQRYLHLSQADLLKAWKEMHKK